MSFKDSIDQALKICPKPDLMISTRRHHPERLRSTEWEACFEIMGDYYAKYPTVTVAGNHEMKGDWNFVSFAAALQYVGRKDPAIRSSTARWATSNMAMLSSLS